MHLLLAAPARNQIRTGSFTDMSRSVKQRLSNALPQGDADFHALAESTCVICDYTRDANT